MIHSSALFTKSILLICNFHICHLPTVKDGHLKLDKTFFKLKQPMKFLKNGSSGSIEEDLGIGFKIVLLKIVGMVLVLKHTLKAM